MISKKLIYLLFLIVFFWMGCDDAGTRPPFAPAWVVVGEDGTVAYTTDSMARKGTWTEVNIGSLQDLHAIASDGKGKWITVGGPGSPLWRIHNVNEKVDITRIDEVPTGFWRTGIATDGTTWMVVGGKTAWNLTLGKKVSNSPHFLSGVATDGTTWVMVGDDGTVIATTDPADTWKVATVPTEAKTQTLRGVATDDKGNWVAVGDNGTVIATTDPAGTWTLATVPTDTQTLRSVAANRMGNWVAVGDGGTVINAWLDPAGTWIPSTVSIAGLPDLYGVDTSGPMWMAVGDGGTVITAVLNPTGDWEKAAVPAGVGQIRIHAVAAYSYALMWDSDKYEDEDEHEDGDEDEPEMRSSTKRQNGNQ